jgi:glycosyltransferase involved in cell wall biosynthesis
MNDRTAPESALDLLVFVPRIPSPPTDGGAIYVYRTIRSLADAGHNITMATFSSRFHPQDPDDIATFATHITTDGLFKPYTLWAALRSLLTRQPIMVQHRMRDEPLSHLLKKLEGRMFDAILIEGIHAATYLSRFRAAFPNTPIVLRQSNVEFELLGRNADAARNPFVAWFYRRQAAFMKRFEIDAMRRADGTTAISDADAATYLKHIPDLRCVTIAPGCHIPHPITPASGRTPSLLAIANWAWTPNHIGLSWFHQNVWPSLRESHPEVTLDIVGGGLPSDLLTALSADPKINLHGFVPETEPFRQSSSVFIAPLLSGGGVKIKIVEAMASGIPIVTTSFGAEGIPVTSGVHLSVANEPGAFADHIRSLLDSPDLRQSYADASLTMAKADFTWESRAKILSDFIRSLRS